MVALATAYLRYIINCTDYFIIIPPPSPTYSDAVDPTHCFWVSQEYHQQAVEYICTHAPPPSDVGGTNTEDDELDTDDMADSVASY